MPTHSIETSVPSKAASVSTDGDEAVPRNTTDESTRPLVSAFSTALGSLETVSSPLTRPGNDPFMEEENAEIVDWFFVVTGSEPVGKNEALEIDAQLDFIPELKWNLSARIRLILALVISRQIIHSEGYRDSFAMNPARWKTVWERVQGTIKPSELHELDDSENFRALRQILSANHIAPT